MKTVQRYIAIGCLLAASVALTALGTEIVFQRRMAQVVKPGPAKPVNRAKPKPKRPGEQVSRQQQEGAWRVVWMKADRVKAWLDRVQPNSLETIGEARQRLEQAGHEIVTVTPGPFHANDVRFTPVGRNLIGGQLFNPKDRYSRPYLVFGRRGEMALADTWHEALVRHQRYGGVTAITQLALSLIPWRKGGGSLGVKWRNKRCARFAIGAFGRGGDKRVAVIYHPKCSVAAMRTYCQRLRLTRAYLTDGGSAAGRNTIYRVAFARRSSS